MNYHSHDEAIVRAFIASPRRNRWLESLASAKRRRKFLDCLNHCHDFDERYVTSLPKNTDIESLLTARGAPANCYVISDSVELDNRELSLAEAIEQAEAQGWGTIISCIPGQLAYFYDECGERQFLLERKN
jgi:hypothetical protein